MENMDILRLFGFSLLISCLLAPCASAQDSRTLPPSQGTSADQTSNEIKIKYFALTSGRLAFTYTKDKNRDIYLIDFKTLKVRPLISSPAADEYPSWSPDGQKIAFYSDRSGNAEIYTAKADGTELTRLTNNPGIDEDPDWSPDGRLIVFHSGRTKRGSALYIMNEDGSNQRKLPISKEKESGMNSVPQWSPRGTEIIYSTNEFWPGWDIGILDLREATNKIITSGYQSFCRGKWHPDGGSFAFSYGAGNKIDIWNFVKGAEKLTPLIERPGRDYDAEWSHDGKRLFFVGEESAGSGNYQLFVWEKEANQILQLTEAPGSIRHPSWTPLPEVEQLEEEIREKSIQQQKL